MKTFLFGISGGVVGTLTTLWSIIIFINVRYFLYSSHFCPHCGHTKHKDEWIDRFSSMARCCNCGAIFWDSSNDYRRSYPREKGNKNMSMKFPADLRECITVIFHWKIKKFKEKHPGLFKPKHLETKP